MNKGKYSKRGPVWYEVNEYLQQSVGSERIVTECASYSSMLMRQQQPFVIKLDVQA